MFLFFEKFLICMLVKLKVYHTSTLSAKQRIDKSERSKFPQAIPIFDLLRYGSTVQQGIFPGILYNFRG
jgi:hypothetical protein